MKWEPEAGQQLERLKCASTMPMIASAQSWVGSTYPWGVEAQGSNSRLAARLALQLQCSKSKAIASIYQRLKLTLVCCKARAKNVFFFSFFCHLFKFAVCVSGVRI